MSQWEIMKTISHEDSKHIFMYFFLLLSRGSTSSTLVGPDTIVSIVYL